MGGLFESLSGAKGLRVQGKNQQIIAEHEAEVAEQEGEAAVIRSGFDQMQQAKEAERVKGRLRAGLGEAGATLSPVAVDLELEQTKELELENLLIGFEGQTTKQRAKHSAALSRLQGQLAKQSGKSAARRANIGFGLQLGTLAAGF